MNNLEKAKKGSKTRSYSPIGSENNHKSRYGQYISKNYKKVWFLVLMAVVLTFFFRLIAYLPFVEDLEDKTLDYRFRLAPRPEKADTNIVLAAIDDNTLKFAQSLQQGWPFPREFYAIVTDYLSNQGAKAIIFDLQFYEPDFNRADIDATESDNSFAEAMKSSGRVFLGTQLVPDSSSISELFTQQSLTTPIYSQPKNTWKGVLEPIPMFLQNAAGIGIINLSETREAIVRRIPLFYQLQGNFYPNLALSAAIKTRPKEAFDIQRIPYDHDGNILINWYGRGDIHGVFKYYSFAAILQSAAVKRNQNGIPSISDGTFAGKYVIIGAKAAGLMDLKSTPYTWSVPGMEIWATVLSNLNNLDFVTQAKPFVNWLISFVIVFLVLFSVSRFRGDISSFLNVFSLILFLLFSIFLFKAFRYKVDVIVPVFSYIVTWILIVTISYMMEGKHKKELRLIFSRYLHPDLVQKIVNEPDMVKMGGEEYQATVMFSDIYNFTGFSENKKPKELVNYLNEYFSSFTNAILDYNGLLDKYTGDGLMAVFGVPIPREDHALLACKAALAHRDYALKFLTKETRSASENFHINTRLGINSGTVVAGNIGSERRMEYTSIGDTVNLASRLEGVNKEFHTYIIISESTYELVKNQMICRELDYLKVKGKKEPTRIYELIMEKEKAQGIDFCWIEEYKAALELYRKGQFIEAETIFNRLSEEPWKDTAAETMKKRCHLLKKNPPTDWDGIWVMETK